MASSVTKKNETIVVSALRARSTSGDCCNGWTSNTGRLSLRNAAPLTAVAEHFATSKTAAPEPEVLKIIGNESRRKSNKCSLSSRQIDEVVTAGKADKNEALMIALRLVIDVRNVLVSGRAQTGRSPVVRYFSWQLPSPAAVRFDPRPRRIWRRAGPALS